MIESVRLKRFKNFQDATLKLGPLTILIARMRPEKATSAMRSSSCMALEEVIRWQRFLGKNMSAASACGVALEAVYAKSLTTDRTPSNWSWHCAFPRRLAPPLPSRTESRFPLPSRSPKLPTWCKNRYITQVFLRRMHAEGETGFQTEVPESAAQRI